MEDDSASDSEVTAVALIGPVARQPSKEVPRFSPWRRAGIALLHECKDVDFALYLSHTWDLILPGSVPRCSISHFRVGQSTAATYPSFAVH